MQHSNRAAVLSFERMAAPLRIQPERAWQRDHSRRQARTPSLDMLPRDFQFFIKQQSFSPKKPEIWVTMNFSPADRCASR